MKRWPLPLAPTVDDDNDRKWSWRDDTSPHSFFPRNVSASASSQQHVDRSKGKSNDYVRSALQVRGGEWDEMRVKCLQIIHSEGDDNVGESSFISIYILCPNKAQLSLIYTFESNTLVCGQDVKEHNRSQTPSDEEARRV